MGQFLYKNNKQNNMRTKEEMTQEDFEAFKKHKKMFQYNQEETNELLNLVRLYINPNQPHCPSCTNALRKVKTDANDYLNRNEEFFDKKFALAIVQEEIIEQTQLDVAKAEVEEYKGKRGRPKKK